LVFSYAGFCLELFLSDAHFMFLLTGHRQVEGKGLGVAVSMVRNLVEAGKCQNGWCSGATCVMTEDFGSSLEFCFSLRAIVKHCSIIS